MSSCVSPAASRWRASRRWWAVRLGGAKRTPLAFARVYTTKPLVRAPSGYATATLAPSKGRLCRWIDAEPLGNDPYARHRALRRQILRQRLPLAASPQHIEDPVQHLAHVHRPSAPTVSA